MQPLLDIRQLTVSFLQENKVMDAVKSVSLTLFSSRITALVGESGSGKSVTALSILQLLPNQVKVSGSAFYSCEGNQPINLLSLSKTQIRLYRGKKIAMIFQEPMTSLNPLMTCGKQVMEAVKLHLNLSYKEALQKTIELFTRVELPDPASMVNRYPHELSGGQKQRVMIAMAISCRPDLLIADEPTTALDVQVQKSILSLIKSLQQETGMAVLLITHDLGLVADIADDIYVMKDGEVVETGAAKKVLQHPAQEYSKSLIQSRPTPAKKGKPLWVNSNEITIQNPSAPSPQIHPVDGLAPMLKVNALSKKFYSRQGWFGHEKKAIPALENISFDVWPQETVGLVGESGSGKSTLGKIIAGLITPDSGNITWNQSMETNSNFQQPTAIVFQDPYSSLNPRMTVGAAIAEPLHRVQHAHPTDSVSQKVKELLHQVGLSETAINRYPHQFSGGQRQRICMARALATQPRFIIFDESVSALDLRVQAQILTLINELKANLQLTCLFISHDLPVVHYISDRIMVLQAGKIVEMGDADQIMLHPKAAYTQMLVEAIPGKALFNT